MFCFHKYSVWSKSYKAYSGTRQSCVCLKCGKLKVRKVRSNEFMGDQGIATGPTDSINKIYNQLNTNGDSHE